MSKLPSEKHHHSDPGSDESLLLGLLGVRLTTGYSAQAEARQQMVQLFAAEGVSLDDGIIPGAHRPPA